MINNKNTVIKMTKQNHKDGEGATGENWKGNNKYSEGEGLLHSSPDNNTTTYNSGSRYVNQRKIRRLLIEDVLV